MAGALGPLVDDFFALIGSLTARRRGHGQPRRSTPCSAALKAAIGQLKAAGPKLPPLARNEIATVTGVLQQVLDAADLIEDIHRFVNGFDPSSVEARFRFEWRPEVAPWFFPGITDEPTLDLKPDSLVLAVDGRASGKDGMGVEVLAEIRDFALNLLPGDADGAHHLRPPLLQGRHVRQGRGRCRHGRDRVRRLSCPSSRTSRT